MAESFSAAVDRPDRLQTAGGTFDANGVRDRSMLEVLSDIVETVQKMVRGEVRLAKAEVRDEAAKAWKPLRLLLTGATIGLVGVVFLLVGTVFALTLVIPAWAAAGSVGLVLTLAAGFTISRGTSQLKKVNELRRP